jgi:hypothetical protein
MGIKNILKYNFMACDNSNNANFPAIGKLNYLLTLVILRSPKLSIDTSEKLSI